MKLGSIFLLALCGLGPGFRSAGYAEPAKEDASGAARRFLTRFDAQILDAHAQRYPASCIPSSMEMVLKLLGRVPSSYHELQEVWENKSDGGFKDFDGKTIAGVTFRLKFALPSNSEFPLAELFDTIHRELEAGRFVIVSLASRSGWHMWVIYDEDTTGEFLAISKNGPKTIEEPRAKEAIRKMQGTHICTYEFPTSPMRLPSAPPRSGPPAFIR